MGKLGSAKKVTKKPTKKEREAEYCSKTNSLSTWTGITGIFLILYFVLGIIYASACMFKTDEVAISLIKFFEDLNLFPTFTAYGNTLLVIFSILLVVMIILVSNSFFKIKKAFAKVKSKKDFLKKERYDLLVSSVESLSILDFMVFIFLSQYILSIVLVMLSLFIGVLLWLMEDQIEKK